MSLKIFKDSRDPASDEIKHPLMWVGRNDKNGDKIFEGDMVYSKFLNKRIKVNDFCEFLIFCGAFNERYNADIFETLEIVKEDK